MAVESAFLHVMISLGILLFAAKLMAELFHKLKLPIVLGELLAGIIVGAICYIIILHHLRRRVLCGGIEEVESLFYYCRFIVDRHMAYENRCC
jgi:Kef-type K+ transport system membrane component KefB